MEVTGKSAVVTGGAAGIGRAIAARLAREGADVRVADIDEEAGRQVAEEIGATFVAADVTSEPDVEAIAADLDILVNNAGGYTEPVFPDATVAHWSRALDLNLRSAMLAIHFAVRAMERRGGGAIVNIASTSGLGFAPHPSPEYAATKAGLMRLTACLAPLGERGIRVNCVCPYTVGTDRRPPDDRGVAGPGAAAAPAAAGHAARAGGGCRGRPALRPRRVARWTGARAARR